MGKRATIQLWEGTEEGGELNGTWELLDLGLGGVYPRITLDSGQTLHLFVDGVTFGEEEPESPPETAPPPKRLVLQEVGA